MTLVPFCKRVFASAPRFIVRLIGAIVAVLSGISTAPAQTSPSLTDYWNGNATWASDANNIGNAFGFHFLSAITNGSETWAYYIGNYYGPSGTIKSGTSRARSSDGINWTNDSMVLNVGGAPQRYLQSETAVAGDHETGRAEGDGWSATTSLDSAGYLVRGPNVQDVPAGTNSAVFRLLINKFLVNSNVKAVTLDVYDQTTGQVLTSKDVFRDDFLNNNAHQEFTLPFTNTAGHTVAFRTYWWDTAYIRQDYVGVIFGGAPYWDDRLASFPGIWKDGDTWYLVYEGAAENIPFSPGDIGLATSTDGKYFIKHPNNPILRHDTTGWEKINIGTPSLFKENGIWYLFYHGYSGNFVRMGVATGPTLTNLTKFAGNPIIDVAPGTNAWDCGTAGKRSAIVKEGPYYYLAYEGSTRQPFDQAKWSSGLARSTNLFHWTKFPGNPVIPQTTTSFGFDGPEIMQFNGTSYMYVRTSDGTGPTKRFRLAATPPAITAQPQSQTVLAGSNPTFNVSATGTPPLNYQWKFNAGIIFRGTNSSYTRTNAQPNHAGNYTVIITNSVGSVTSVVATLTVNVPPTITTQPQSRSVISRTNVTFSVGVSGSTPLSYQWRFGTTPISNATNSSYTLNNVQISDAGTYSVVVTNVAGSVTSADALLTVTDPPSIILHPQNQTVIVGSNVEMSATASGSPPLSYRWRKNGLNLSDGGTISGATTATLNLSNVTRADAAGYSVVITNSAGLAMSGTATLNVNEGPNATLTVQATSIGTTPNLLAYNSGHFYPGSNTRDWWRYSGVSGARVFLTANLIEASDDIPGHGDGVTDQTSFIARKSALRANPNSSSYINWPYFNGQYNATGKHGANRFQPNYILTELRKLGVQIDVNIGASQHIFVISDTNDWAGKWELWQHYYAQAFYLGRHFDVERHQMYNEPDHPNAGGLTTADYLQRLQLCSDAVQSALADVNSIYGKALVPKIVAPVVTTPSYGSWAENVITNRHLNFLGQTDPNFSLLHQYDYHQYNASPEQFGTILGNLRSSLATAMSPEPPYPVSISEFNVHTAGVFDTMPDTLDYPSKYLRLGAIAVNLVENGMHELYNFKFSQTDGDAGDAYPVRKNGMHYVDNGNAPYDIGGITKAGEVWRLFNKGFAPGRERLGILKSPNASELDVQASYDPVSRRYYIFSANHTTNDVNLNLNLSGLTLPTNGKVLVEEVSEGCYGAGKFWTTVGAAGSTLGTQAAHTVWLITASRVPEQSERILESTEDAEVRDGANKGVNFGPNTTLTARNDPNTTDNRSVAFLKFQLPTNNFSELQYAVLSLQACSTVTNNTAQAHVYAITNNTWSQGTLTWNNAPNLKSNVPSGVTLSQQFITGQGTNLSIVGQVVASSTVPAEKLIDVTSYLHGHSNSIVSFLISQEPRWNVTLPSLAPGDTQQDGVRILSSESGSGPQLRLVFRLNSATNIPPTAADDHYTTSDGTELVVSAPGVLVNDFDADNDPLSAILVSAPSNGSVTFNSNGTFNYTSIAGFSGVDSFVYKVSDGQTNSELATVWISVNPSGGTPYSTNLLVATEAFICGGTSATNDQDEVATGYLLIKYNPFPYNAARKAYFQFDFTGLGVNLDTQAVFTVTTHTTNSPQRAQLWALNQAYTNFSPQITWNNAQANDTASNDLLTSGGYNATRIGESVLFTLSKSVPYTFTIPRLGDFAFGNRVTLILSGVEDDANSAGGLRLARTSATLSITAGLASPQISEHPVSRTNAAGSTVTFSVTATGTLPLAHQWKKNGSPLLNGGNVSGATSATLVLHNVTAEDSAGYSVSVGNGAGSATSSPAILTVLVPPRFEQVSIAPNGGCRMILSGQSNFTYTIEGSTNLVNWVLLTNINSSTGRFEFTDESAINHLYRFYRAK